MGQVAARELSRLVSSRVSSLFSRRVSSRVSSPLSSRLLSSLVSSLISSLVSSPLSSRLSVISSPHASRVSPLFSRLVSSRVSSLLSRHVSSRVSSPLSSRLISRLVSRLFSRLISSRVFVRDSAIAHGGWHSLTVWVAFLLPSCVFARSHAGFHGRVALWYALILLSQSFRSSFARAHRVRTLLLSSSINLINVCFCSHVWGFDMLGGRVRAQLASAVSLVCSGALGQSHVSLPMSGRGAWVQLSACPTFWKDLTLPYLTLPYLM